MLDKLTITNFQCHRHLTIEFDPELTVIVGPSDRGKSSIIRALKWVCLNKPAGAEFIRNWSKSDRTIMATAHLEVSDRRVIRQRSKSDNLYQFGEESFRSFGSSVPDPIANLLRVSELNFQDQHEPAFWFHLSAGQVSKELNSIVDLSIIDSAITNARSELGKAKASVEYSKEALTEAQQKFDDLEWVPDFVEAVGDLRDEAEAEIERASEIDSKARLIEEVEDIEGRAERTGESILALSKSISAVKEVERLETQMDELERLLDSIEAVEERSCQSESKLKRVKHELNELTKRGCPLCGNPM